MIFSCIEYESKDVADKNRVFKSGNDFYIYYNGKFVEKATDSSMVGNIGNKSVSNKALIKINEQVTSVIAVRLPAEKPVKVMIQK